MRYFPLSPRKNFIRLLILKPGKEEDPIECDLILHDLDHPVSRTFVALSYSWGSVAENDYIILKGERFGVRPNLKAALHHIRSLLVNSRKKEHKNFYLWIDAICINQQDLRERSEQVVRMTDIYSAAALTIIWLGESTSSSDRAMDFINQREKQAYEMNPDLLQAWNYREEYLALVRGVFLREWWQRMWVVQEVIVSPTLLVVCGYKTVSWKLLLVFLLIVEEYHKPAVSEVLRSVEARAKGMKEDLGFRLDGNRTIWRQSGRLPIFRLLTEFRNWKATKPVDKVYGVLGMAIEARHAALTPNYQYAPQKVFTNVTRFIIEQHQKLDFILFAAGSQKLDSLPSWNPDFTVPGFEIATPLKGLMKVLDHYLYSAAKEVPMAVSFSPDNTIMYANGIVADAIDCLAPYWDPELSTQDFEEQLAAGTTEAWTKLINPLAGKIERRYGLETIPAVAIGKMLTADRTVDQSWTITRFGNGESFLNVSIETPEDYQDVGTPEQQDYQWQQARKSMIEGTLSRRRFMITATGYMGLVPETSLSGDLICVLFGCDSPVVLRPRDSHYVLVGECYVYGIMDGELVDALDNGVVAEKSFEIR